MNVVMFVEDCCAYYVSCRRRFVGEKLCTLCHDVLHKFCQLNLRKDFSKFPEHEDLSKRISEMVGK